MASSSFFNEQRYHSAQAESAHGVDPANAAANCVRGLKGCEPAVLSGLERLKDDPEMVDFATRAYKALSEDEQGIVEDIITELEALKSPTKPELNAAAYIEAKMLLRQLAEVAEQAPAPELTKAPTLTR